MKISPRQYAQSILECLEDASPEKGKILLNNFFQAIEENNDVKLLPDIIEEIEKVKQRKMGIKKTAIITALDISKDLKREIRRNLEEKFKAKVEPEYEIRPEILGGIIIESEDEILDASMRAWLNKFKQSLSA